MCLQIPGNKSKTRTEPHGHVHVVSKYVQVHIWQFQHEIVSGIVPDNFDDITVVVEKANKTGKSTDT